jgi:uncharacterized protein (TIGR00369 family)
MTQINQLENWLAQERQQQSLFEAGVGMGTATPSQVAGMSGVEMLTAMLAGKVPYPSILKTMDFLLMEVEEGRAVFQGSPGRSHLNPMGSIHGGWYATLLDSAAGCAIHTKLPYGRALTTADLGLYFVKAIGSKVPRVRAEGKLIHCGRQLATAEARLYGPDGTLYAHATTTCLVFDMPTEKAA